MKRILSTLLIVCTCAQPVIPVLAQQPATITITSMDRGSVRPFDRLVISGSGFQPATSAISVLFMPKQHGLPIVIPAFSATATRVEVIVPAFLDPAAGDFGFGQADLQVVQVTRDQVMSSNVLTGLDVAPVPSMPDSVGAGKMTRAFMRLSLEFLTTAGSAPSADARSAFEAFRGEQSAMLGHVEQVVANVNGIAGAKTIDSSAFVVDAAMLKASDRLIAAYLKSLTPLIDGQRLDRDRAGAQASESCTPDTGSNELDETLCDLRTSVVTASRNWITGIALVAGGLAVLIALTATGPLMMGVGAAAGAGLFLAGAAQLVYLGVSSTLTPSLIAADAPPIMDTMRDHGRAMLENASGMAAATITSATTLAADAVSQVGARITSTPSQAPKGGTTITASRIGTADSIREMVSFPSGTNTVATRIGVPATQLTRSLAEARIAPPAAGGFDGAYAGEMNWSRTDGETTGGGTERVSFTVAGNTVTVSAPYGGTGSINQAGRVVGVSGVTPAGFTCTFGGVLAMTATGAAAGGGTLGCVPKDGFFTAGAWSAARARTP